MKLIVGIDPGVTTGIAVLDLNLDSKFCIVLSEKSFSLSNICEYLSDIGTPVVIATDVSKPPMLIKKIAASFNAVIIKPRENMATSRKKRLVKNFSFGNRHERDALAAALNAKKRLSVFLRKIDEILKKKDYTHLSDDVKSLIIRGKAGNVDQALLLIRKK